MPMERADMLPTTSRKPTCNNANEDADSLNTAPFSDSNIRLKLASKS